MKSTQIAGLAAVVAVAGAAFYFTGQNSSPTPAAKTAPEAAPEVVASTCGKVTIADMNWNSASLMANVDQFILKNGYGCETELVPGDTMATGASMVEKGEPDIAPEMWSNALKESLDKGVAEKRLRYAGDTFSDGGEEGFWVPKYMVDQDPSLATIEGVINSKALFKHPENPDLGGFYTCPAGWNCESPQATCSTPSSLTRKVLNWLIQVQVLVCRAPSPKLMSASSPGSATTGPQQLFLANMIWSRSTSVPVSIKTSLPAVPPRKTA